MTDFLLQFEPYVFTLIGFVAGAFGGFIAGKININVRGN